VASGRHFGAIFQLKAYPGGSWDASWRILEASRGVLEASWGVSGAGEAS